MQHQKNDFQPFKLHKFDQGPSESVTITRDEALVCYRQMQTIRRLETSAGNLYKEKIVRGFCHLYSGQEACAVGNNHNKKKLFFFCYWNEEEHACMKNLNVYSKKCINEKFYSKFHTFRPTHIR